MPGRSAADCCGVTWVAGLRDLALTTNGLLLSGMAKTLYNCGLKRVNISLPSLNADTYRKLTGGNLQDALRGIDAAIEADYCPVKLNTVVLREVNVGDVPSLIDYAGQKRRGVAAYRIGPRKRRHRRLPNPSSQPQRTRRGAAQMAVTVEKRPFMHNRLIYHLPNAIVEVVHPSKTALLHTLRRACASPATANSNPA